MLNFSYFLCDNLHDALYLYFMFLSKNSICNLWNIYKDHFRTLLNSNLFCFSLRYAWMYKEDARFTSKIHYGKICNWWSRRKWNVDSTVYKICESKTNNKEKHVPLFLLENWNLRNWQTYFDKKMFFLFEISLLFPCEKSCNR